MAVNNACCGRTRTIQSAGDAPQQRIAADTAQECSRWGQSDQIEDFVVDPAGQERRRQHHGKPDECKSIAGARKPAQRQYHANQEEDERQRVVQRPTDQRLPLAAPVLGVNWIDQVFEDRQIVILDQVVRVRTANSVVKKAVSLVYAIVANSGRCT